MGRELISKINETNVTTRNRTIFIFRMMGSDVSHFNVSFIVQGKVSRQCP